MDMSSRIQVGLLEAIIALVISSVPLSAQEVSGRVTDAKSGEALVGAIVRSLNDKGETVGYVMTGKDGRFIIQAGKDVRAIKIALLGYKEKTLEPPFVKNPGIALVPEDLKIKESVVQARKVRMAGDTAIYNVKALTTRDDLVLGDVLKRIPGIEVTSSGHLKVDGRDLGKFYVNGKDVLEGNYNLATKKLSVDAVKKVEVMRNHQYIKMLRGMQESDQAAVNIVLDEKAKGKVNAIGALIGGYQAGKPYIPNSESATAFYLGDGLSSVLDAGFDASGKPSRGITYYRLPLSDNRYSIQSELNMASAKAPLSDSRSLFNKSLDLRTVNTLTPSDDIKTGATFSYSWDERNSSDSRISVYHFEDRPDKTITRIEDRIERNAKMTGKINYSDNSPKHYISDALFADMGKGFGTASVSGDDILGQRGERKSWDINNNLGALFKTGSGRALGVKSYTQLSGFTEGLDILTGPQKQDIHSSAIFEDLSLSDISRMRGDFSFSLQPVLKWTLFERSSSLKGMTEDEILGRKEDKSRATYLTGGLDWSVFYRKGRFSASVRGNLHYDRASYGPYKTDRFLSDESIGVKYETGRLMASVGGGVSTSRPDIQDLGSVLILYDYDGLRRGQESLAFLPERYVQGEVVLREPVSGWYLRASSRFDKTESLLGGRDVLENYILSYNTDGTVGHGVWASSAEITKGLYSINGKISARVVYNRSSSTLMQNGVSTGYVSKLLSPSVELSTSPLNFWNITGSAAMSFFLTEAGGGHVGKTMSATASVTNSFYLSERISAGLVTDIFHNSTVGKTTVFPDAFITWKSPKKLRLRLQANNLMNMKEYSYVSINPLMETTYSYKIRPLSIMLSANWTL